MGDNENQKPQKLFLNTNKQSEKPLKNIKNKKKIRKILLPELLLFLFFVITLPVLSLNKGGGLNED